MDRDTMIRLLADRVKLGVIPLDKVPESYRVEVTVKLNG